MTFAIRSDRVGTAGSLEPELPLARTERMSDLHRQAMERTTLTLILIGITGAMAAMLGLVGIYGVTIVCSSAGWDCWSRRASRSECSRPRRYRA